ncbi:transmembrane protein, putative [Bodo saltans]|uniref:Transmembrane protein, putative n=1 Tax=Bodo saltans TaxID=75058 RepID=A0A0S4J6K5_BODSA|nr:transmembrane protein, putative [Bodo saltans]|eukprot:CUG68640.1 transmembrane protein, putative [Bodo saltans]
MSLAKGTKLVTREPITMTGATTQSNKQCDEDSPAPSPLAPPAPPSSLRCHLALGASQIIFAASMTFVRSAFRSSEEVSPIIIVWSRLFLSTLVFTVVHLVRMQQRMKELSGLKSLPSSVSSNVASSPGGGAAGEVERHEIMHADEFDGLTRAMKIRSVLLGAIGITINLLGSASGVKYSNAVTAGGIQCAVPPVTCVIAYFVYGEMLPMTKVIALVLAVSGNMIMTQIWCLFTTSDACTTMIGNGSSYYFGCLCVVVNVTVYSLYLVFQRPVVKLLPTSEFLFRSCLYGLCSISIIALCAWTMIWDEITTPGVMSQNVFIAIGFAGVINSGLAYYLVSVGISGLTPSIAGIYFCSQPILICIFSTVFLGEGVSAIQAGGGALVMIGLLLGAVPPHYLPRWCRGGDSDRQQSAGDEVAQCDSNDTLPVIITESPRHCEQYDSLENASPTITTA